MKMKLSLRIPLVLTMIVFMTGVVVFIKRTVRGLSLPTTDVIIWIVASVILAGITVWSWQRGKKS